MSATAGEYYTALYDYQATSSNGLHLRRGETVLVYDKSAGNGWFSGEASLGFGWFPESYVQKQDICADDTGRTYFVDVLSQQTSWERPTAPAKASTLAARDSGDASLPAQVPQQQQQQLAEGSGARSSNDATSAKDEPALAIKSEVVEVEGKQFAVDANGKITYMDNFWTDKDSTTSGFDVLVLKHRNGKDVLKEISEWTRERAAIEERYAKDLQRLSKSPLGNLEEGTMKTAWNQAKFEADGQSRIHMQLAQDLLDQVEKPLIDFKDKQKKKRKDFETTIAKDRKNMAIKEEAADKARKLYMQKMKDAEIAEAQQTKAENKDVSRLTETARSEKKKATQAGIDYKKAVDEYDAMRRHWEDDMNLATLDFQEAEEERIEQLKQTLEAYLDAAKRLRDRLQTASEMTRSSVQAVSTEVDIDMFVKAKGTGTRKPPTVTFKQYGSK